MIVDKDERIVQLVAAPAEMTAVFEWWNEEIDDETTECYTVACFALVENSRGQRIEPVIVDDDTWQNAGLALASDFKGYKYCFVNSYEPAWTNVKTQNGGICPVNESTAITIDLEPAIGYRPATINAVKDGLTVNLGYYDDIYLAQVQLDYLMQKIAQKSKSFEMKTSKDIESVLDYKELNKAFGGKTQALYDAGFHSIKEIKKATDEELTAVKLVGIGKAKRAGYIRQQIVEYEAKYEKGLIP